MSLRACILGLFVASVSSLALAIEEPFCNIPANCVNDVMSVKFAGAAEVTNVTLDQALEATVQIDEIFSTPTQGFSYGLQHDAAFLEITTVNSINSVSTATITPQLFDANGEPILDANGNPTFGPDEPLPRPKNAAGVNLKWSFEVTVKAETGNGIISAIVLAQQEKVRLPDGSKNYKICDVKYKVKAVPPAAGTKIFFTSELNPAKSPKTAVNLTVGAKSKQPTKVNNALVKGGAAPVDCALPPFGFYFGSPAAGVFDIAAAKSVKVQMRNKDVVSLGFSLGIKKAAGVLTFENTLGPAAGQETELVITYTQNNQLLEKAGAELKGNSATGAPADNLSGITRGAALTGNDPGDFLGVDVTPTVGGPGATVGYVADTNATNKSIPATADAGQTCNANEILIVNFGGPVLVKFSRGDGNGDGKINVTDGVVVAQNIFATKFVFFDCKDMLDTNDDGTLNTADPVFLLTHIFLRGPAPAAPFRACGADGTPADALGCAAPNCQ